MEIASEHIVCYLDGEDKKVVGTTYHELRHLVKSIEQWGFFGSESEVASADGVPDGSSLVSSDSVSTADDAINVSVLDPASIKEEKESAVAKNDWESKI